MGRKIPLADDLSISLYQTVSFSLLLAGMAAVIAISTPLCGVRFRRRSSSESKSLQSSSPLDKQAENVNLTTTSLLPSPSTLKIKIQRAVATVSKQKQHQHQAVDQSENAKERDENEFDETNRNEHPHPLLPSAKQLKETFSCKNLVAKSASSRNLVKSLSMKMPIRSMTMARREKENKNKWKHEDSIWMKTIILGEKCRVPDEDDPEAVIYDSKGNRISTYHPKTPKSLPAVSRQNSFIEHTSIPS